jgi:hypothetical protein
VLGGDGSGIGQAVGALDFNGDGAGDIVVAAASYYGARTDGVSVYLGGPLFDAVPDGVLFGGDPGDEFGLAVLHGFH